MGSFLTQIKFPTVLGLALIAVGIGSGVYLTVSNQTLISQATPNQTPIDVRLTNIGATSATISWRTNTDVRGFISFSTEGSGGNSALDIRDKGIPSPHNIHYVVLNDLIPRTIYKYRIISGKLNNLPEEQFTTAPESISQSNSKPIIGNVIDDNKPLDEGVVYLDIDGATEQSALVKNLGSFIIPTNSILKADLTDSFDPVGEEIKITATTKDGRIGTITFKLTDQNQIKEPIKIGEDQTLPEDSNALGISITFAQILNEQNAKANEKFDLNNDGKINSLDYANLQKNFGKVTTKNKKYDLNGDGAVNKKDQDILSIEITKATNR